MSRAYIISMASLQRVVGSGRLLLNFSSFIFFEGFEVGSSFPELLPLLAALCILVITHLFLHYAELIFLLALLLCSCCFFYFFLWFLSFGPSSLELSFFIRVFWNDSWEVICWLTVAFFAVDTLRLYWICSKWIWIYKLFATTTIWITLLSLFRGLWRS